MDCESNDNSLKYAFWLDVCIIALALAVCAITESGWGLLALMFLVSPSRNDCEEANDE